jgi:hypothetical protein
VGRKIIEKFNDLKIEKFAPETAELEIGFEVSGWIFLNTDYKNLFDFLDFTNLCCSIEKLAMSISKCRQLQNSFSFVLFQK